MSMKLAVSSYSFAALGIGDKECIRLAAEMGFDAIEFAEINPGEQDKKAYAEGLREYSEKLGLPIVNYSVGADFLNRDLRDEINRLRGEVDIAGLLGVRNMRHDATSGKEKERFSLNGFEKHLPTLAEGCRAVTEYAAEKGIRTSVENHGYYCQQYDRVEALIRAVASPNFGWQVDIGNFLCADGDPLESVRTAAKYAFIVHIKDFFFSGRDEAAPEGYFDTRGGNHLCGCIPGEGIVPVKECIDVIRSSGFDGVYTFEYEGHESPLTAIPKGLDFINPILRS